LLLSKDIEDAVGIFADPEEFVFVPELDDWLPLEKPKFLTISFLFIK